VTQTQRCGWCGGQLPDGGKIGRPRRYCGQPCRQRAYEHRHIAARAGLDADAVVVSARELHHLQDRLFALRCAVEDVQTALAEDATGPELAATVHNLTESVGTLDKIWIAPRAT